MDTVQRVEYFYVQVPDKPGEGIKALRHLQQAGVNLLAFSGFPSGKRAQLDLVPADGQALKQVAKQNKWKLIGPKRAFLIAGDDRVGAIADVIGQLAAAKVGVTACDAVCADGKFGAILWVLARDFKKAARALGA